jgi:hypothetical protein
MSDIPRTVALCCYKHRAVVLERCDHCKSEYACPEFKSKAAVVEFNALIPPSMLLAPLPIELWPNMCAYLARQRSPPSSDSASASNESTPSPVRRFVSTLVNRNPNSS